LADALDTGPQPATKEVQCASSAPRRFSSAQGSYIRQRFFPSSGGSSGVPSRHPPALKVAAELAAKHPNLVLRNPEKREQAWDLQREERRHFIEFFGSDPNVVPGQEVVGRMQEFLRYWTFEARGADGKIPAERVQAGGGAVATVPEQELPDA